MVDEAQGDLLTQEASQTETTSWYSEDNKEVGERCGWKDANEAIQSYRNMEKMSSGKVKMPTPESSAEEIRAFYQKTGCPENPEGYDIPVTEELQSYRDEGIENAMKQIAHTEGVSKQAFEAIVKGYYDSLDAGIKASRDAGEVELKKEFPGDQYKEVLNGANRFFDTCSEEFCEMVKASGLANNPVFIKEFYNKGLQTANDNLIKGVEPDAPDGYTPVYKDSPEMYATGDDEDSVKARAYFVAKGHTY